MRDIKNEIVKMLRDEVKPAVGCTEPVAVALACVKAKELLNEDVVTNEVLVSPNIYKNGMCVGIPGTDRLGLKISVAMGIVGGKSSDGLSVLEGLTEEEVRLAEKYMDENDINVLPLETEKKVYIEVILKGANNKVKVCIDEKHDNFVFIQSNEEILLNNIEEDTNNSQTEEKVNILDDATVRELVKNIEEIEYKEIEFLLEGIEMNYKVAEHGLNEKTGIGVGYGIKKSIERGILGDDLLNNTMMITAAASDARMAGIKMPVMSSNGSGNHGLTAILPLVAYNNKFPQTDEKLVRALAISHVITAYVKNFTGRLSAVCGCGVAASTGATAAISWLIDGDMSKIEGAIMNMVADLSGMICDGAKAGCALKLASASSAAIKSALIASEECFVPVLNGIVGTSVEESIKNLGKVSNKGMRVTDGVIIDVMNDMNKVK